MRHSPLDVAGLGFGVFLLELVQALPFQQRKRSH